MRITRAGFTLIELLVVVAIIAILAAILLPIFAQAVHQAKETHCQNNLKNIGNAFEMYRNDWNDFYPVAHNHHNDDSWEPEAYHTGTVGGAMEPFWWEAILPYVKNRDIFKDPLDKGIGESFGAGYDSMYDYWAAQLVGSPWNRQVDESGQAMSCSYVWNGTLGWVSFYQLYQRGLMRTWRPPSTNHCNYRTMKSTGGGPSPKMQGQIQRPAVRYLCWDTIGFWHRVRKIRQNNEWVGVSAGWTVLFTDTHVKWVNWKDFDETGYGLPEEEITMAWYVPIELELAP